MTFLQGLPTTLRAQFKISHDPAYSGPLSSLCLQVGISLGSYGPDARVPAPLAYVMDQNSEFSISFHSSSAWPRILSNPPVSASLVCPFGLWTSGATLSGQWVGSRILGLVQKLHLTGRFHTVLQRLAGLSASPGSPLSRDTESPPSGLSEHTPPAPAVVPYMQNACSLMCCLLHCGGHSKAAAQPTAPSHFSLSVILSRELGMSTPGKEQPQLPCSPVSLCRS